MFLLAPADRNSSAASPLHAEQVPISPRLPQAISSTIDRHLPLLCATTPSGLPRLADCHLRAQQTTAEKKFDKIPVEIWVMVLTFSDLNPLALLQIAIEFGRRNTAGYRLAKAAHCSTLMHPFVPAEKETSKQGTLLGAFARRLAPKHGDWERVQADIGGRGDRSQPLPNLELYSKLVQQAYGRPGHDNSTLIISFDLAFDLLISTATDEKHAKESLPQTAVALQQGWLDGSDYVKIALQAVTSIPELWTDVITPYRFNRHILTVAVQQKDLLLLRFADEAAKNDRSIVMTAVAANGMALQFASPALQDDEEIVSEALRSRHRSCPCPQPHSVFSLVNQRLRNVRSVGLAAVRAYSGNFVFLGNIPKGDKETVMLALQYDGYLLQLASENLKNDREVVTKAMQSYAFSFNFASESLRDDETLLRLALTKCGGSFAFASQRLRANRAVTLTAVKRAGSSLMHADAALKDDREIVAAAVARTPSALHYASDRLRNDRDLAKLAVGKSGSAISTLSSTLQLDPAIIALANESSSRRKTVKRARAQAISL